MLELDEHNAADYLRAGGWIDRDERIAISALAGGVSNQVLYVARADRPGHDFVLKQVRAQLRTADPWFASIERIWREVEVLQVCQALVANEPPAPPGELSVSTPAIVFEDRTEYAFAMTAAPREHHVWKRELLSGRADPRIARACGRLLGALHGASWRDAALQRRLGDRQLFDELRLDPYYRATARTAPEARAAFEALIASQAAQACALVHADFSPKNLLVWDGGLMMVDFETGHYGDPAFDLGFFLSHLVLKTFELAPRLEECAALTSAFWAAYEQRLAQNVPAAEFRLLVRRAIRNLAGCAWARLDGTSKIDYLADPARREAVRGLCRHLLLDHAEDAGTDDWNDVLAQVRARCEQLARK